MNSAGLKEGSTWTSQAGRHGVAGIWGQKVSISLLFLSLGEFRDTMTVINANCAPGGLKPTCTTSFSKRDERSGPKGLDEELQVGGEFSALPRGSGGRIAIA